MSDTTFRKIIVLQDYNPHPQQAIVLWTDPVQGGGNRHRVILAKPAPNAQEANWYTTANIYDENIISELAPAGMDETTNARRQADTYNPNKG